MTLLFIFFIVGTFVIDFFTYKKDTEIVSISDAKANRVITNFIGTALTFIIFTIAFAVIFRYALVDDNYLYCTSNCTVNITNTIAGVIVVLLELLNLYSFYDNYIYSYRFLASYSKNLDKIIIEIIGLVTVMLNKFALSYIDLSILTFEYSILNILLRLIIYSPYIFLTVLIIIRELNQIYINRKNQDKEDYYN